MLTTNWVLLSVLLIGKAEKLGAAITTVFGCGALESGLSGFYRNRKAADEIRNLAMHAQLLRALLPFCSSCSAGGSMPALQQATERRQQLQTTFYDGFVVPECISNPLLPADEIRNLVMLSFFGLLSHSVALAVLEGSCLHSNRHQS